MIPLNYIHALPPFADNSRGTLEATIDGFVQIGNNGHLLMAIIGKENYTRTSNETSNSISITRYFYISLSRDDDQHSVLQFLRTQCHEGNERYFKDGFRQRKDHRDMGVLLGS